MSRRRDYIASSAAVSAGVLKLAAAAAQVPHLMTPVRRSASSKTPDPVPEVPSPYDTPLQVRKALRLVWTGGGSPKVIIAGSGCPVYYQVTDTAHCYRTVMNYVHTYESGKTTRNITPHNEGPYPGCTCGFYAPKGIVEHPHGWTADVELYGRIIEHSKGYRAQYQRILSITAPSHCVFGFKGDYFFAEHNSTRVEVGCHVPGYAINPVLPYGQYGRSPYYDLVNTSAMMSHHRNVDHIITVAELRAAIAPAELIVPWQT